MDAKLSTIPVDTPVTLRLLAPADSGPLLSIHSPPAPALFARAVAPVPAVGAVDPLDALPTIQQLAATVVTVVVMLVPEACVVVFVASGWPDCFAPL